MNQETRGGPRKGAGRKPLLDTLARPRLVTLDDKTVEKAREIGSGNVSQGIRTAVEAYTKGAK